jgi:hypothetical protein
VRKKQQSKEGGYLVRALKEMRKRLEEQLGELEEKLAQLYPSR